MLRGKWILENILNAAPPPPPPDVPELVERSEDGKVLSMRERMVRHRANPVCASCHSRMDPLGLALEHFDAVGRWRDVSESQTADRRQRDAARRQRLQRAAGASGGAAAQAERFVSTLTEKLLTYALGRGLTHHDAPTVRAILRDAAADEYRFSNHRPRDRHESSISDEEIAVMMITKAALPRRTFLRGLGATLALPLLDAMVPALSALGKDAGKAVPRLGFIYVPNGAVMDKWTPAEIGACLRVLADVWPRSSRSATRRWS